MKGEGSVSGAGASDRDIDNRAKDLEGKAFKLSPSRHSRAKGQEQERPSGPENNSKKAEELKQPRNRVKAEEKPTISKTKRKRNPPEISHNSFKKPRTHLGMHMLESVQVFHPLGKKSEKKPGISSFGGLQTFSSNKDPVPDSVPTAVLHMPHEDQGPDKTPGNAKRVENSAHKECPSWSNYKLPLVQVSTSAFSTPRQALSQTCFSTALLMALRRVIPSYPSLPHSYSTAYHTQAIPTIS